MREREMYVTPEFEIKVLREVDVIRTSYEDGVDFQSIKSNEWLE